MQLELAVATACEPSHCRVVRLEGRGPIDAVYGAKVLNRIRVRPGDLVAIDLTEQPPAVVWRWWHGTVQSLSDDGVLLERRVTKRAPDDTEGVMLAATLPDHLRGQVTVGATVFFTGHGDEGTTVVGVSRDLGAVDSARLQGELLPGVAAAYRAMGG
ncbi:MAG TPA: hypothetical protein VFD32_15515 [Dehalococcoidia bacterium]|nr:hypothetical protein [Dehalococcoidia bacterium]